MQPVSGEPEKCEVPPVECDGDFYSFSARRNRELNVLISELRKQLVLPLYRGRIEGVPGVGPTTSATLVAELRELGRLNRQETASLAGLTAFNHDSGKFRGYSPAARYVHIATIPLGEYDRCEQFFVDFQFDSR